MAKAKRARRNSVRTMETDPDALSVLDRLEQLDAEERAKNGAPQATSDDSDSDSDSED